MSHYSTNKFIMHKESLQTNQFLSTVIFQVLWNR